MRLTAAFAAAFVFAICAGARAQDSAMTCPQIMAGVNEQNAIIKQQSDITAQLSGGGQRDPGDADPAIALQKARIKSDRATKRANALVALGRQKQCFK